MTPEEFAQLQAELAEIIGNIPDMGQLDENKLPSNHPFPEVPKGVVPPLGPAPQPIPGWEQLPELEKIARPTTPPQEASVELPGSVSGRFASRPTQVVGDTEVPVTDSVPITSDAAPPTDEEISERRRNYLMRSPEGRQQLIQEDRMARTEKLQEDALSLQDRFEYNEDRREKTLQEGADKKAALFEQIEKQHADETAAARERVAKRMGELDAARVAVKDVEAGKFFGDMGTVGKAVFAISFLLGAIGDTDGTVAALDKIVQEDVAIQMQNQKKALEQLYSLERALDKDMTFNEFLMKRMKEQQVITMEKVKSEVEAKLVGVESEDSKIKYATWVQEWDAKIAGMQDDIAKTGMNLEQGKIDAARQLRRDEANRAFSAQEANKARGFQRAERREATVDKEIYARNRFQEAKALSRVEMEAGQASAQAKAAQEENEKSFEGEPFGIYTTVTGPDGRKRRSGKIVLKDKEARRELGALAAQQHSTIKIKNRILEMDLTDLAAWGNAEQQQAVGAVLSKFATGPGAQRISDKDLEFIEAGAGLAQHGSLNKGSNWNKIKGLADQIDQGKIKAAIRASIRDDQFALEAALKVHDKNISVNWTRGSLSADNEGDPEDELGDRTVGISGGEFSAVARDMSHLYDIPNWHKLDGGRVVADSFSRHYGHIKESLNWTRRKLNDIETDTLIEDHRILSGMKASDRKRMVSTDNLPETYKTNEDPLMVIEEILVDKGPFSSKEELLLKIYGE